MFQSLLKDNNRALDQMANAGEMLGGDFLFDKQYLLAQSQEFALTIDSVIRNLNFITNNKYPALSIRFEKIQSNINAILTSEFDIADTPHVLPMDAVDSNLINAAGGKMGTLGEINQRFGYKIPSGFVITFKACRNLFKQCGLSARIDAVSKKIESGELYDQELDKGLEELRDIIINISLPAKIKRAIKQAVKSLNNQSKDPLILAVRSSAAGEDSDLSYAGIYNTCLCVKPKDVLHAYKKVVASLFSMRAIAYRKSHNESLQTALMAVGCLKMVRAQSSGVLYTLDPNDPGSDVLLVSAASGLGKIVVEGEERVDRFVISRSIPHKIVSRKITNKEKMFTIGSENELAFLETPASQANSQAVSDDFLIQLVSAALQIEHYMKTPQDIEWSMDENGDLVFLQARPLQIQSDMSTFRTALTKAAGNYRALISDRGVVACRGIGYGTVVIVDGKEVKYNLPKNAVLVARHSSLELAELIPQASALITDIGAPNGHLAVITRELRVPTIMDAGIATSVLKDGMEVTVDAEENMIYEGKVEELLLYQVLRKSHYENINEFRILRRMLKEITPLNLKNPQNSNFLPKYCQTYHDILRFAHEKAVASLIDGSDISTGDRKSFSKKIDLKIPLDLVAVNISDCIRKTTGNKSCGIEDINCAPLNSLLEGMMLPGVWSEEPANVDLGSFMSSFTSSSAIVDAQTKGLVSNLAIISENYLNLSLYLGYHFNQVDSYVSADRNGNYIYFRFSGGVTNKTRRARRAKMISIILKQQDFAVDISGDFIIARLKKIDQDDMLLKLKMIGCLIGYTRQMDVMMINDAMIDKGVVDFREQLNRNM